MIEFLTEDVVLITDGGGKVLAAFKPIATRKNASAFISGIYKKGAFAEEFLPIFVNGQKGILQVQENRSNRIICFEFDLTQKNIRKIFVLSNPDKLRHIPF